MRLLIRCSFSGCPEKGNSKSGHRGDEKVGWFRQRGQQILKYGHAFQVRETALIGSEATAVAQRAAPVSL